MVTDFLVFTLESRMASFGGLAGHERRGSDTWPGRSALIGLLGAALGARREDEDELKKLRTLSFAVAAYDTGQALRDFHTTQAVHQRIKRPHSRVVAVTKAKKIDKALNTIITQRDYRCGVLYGVAAWGGDWNLNAIPSALAKPRFVPYLGRKSCPLSAPLAALVVKAEHPSMAVDNAVLPPWRTDKSGKGRPPKLFMASDPHPALEADTIEWRYDEPVDRDAWHFHAREVHIIREAQK